tara:strand:- start:194 stop:976 length:783 start_codon:yes stop_codon:yes gene_type:complete
MSIEKDSKSIYNDGYVKGHNDGWRGAVKAYGFGKPDNEVVNKLDKKYKEGYNDCSEELHSIFGERELEIKKDSYQEGYAQAYSEIHAPTTERERQLQEKAWDEGYVSAIKDFLAQGEEFVSNKGYYEFSYEIGAEQFIKENMDNIKSYTRVGEVVSIELYNIDCEHIPNKETQEAMQEVLHDNNRKHSHYYKDVRHLDYVDVYQVNKLFPVKDDTDCILHARKKLLVCGGRGGGKDMLKDVTEAYDTLKRYLEIEGHLDD